MVLGGLWAIFWQAYRPEEFLSDSGADLVCKKDAIWEAKSEQKVIRNRIEILKGKKMPLGSDMGRFEVDFQAVLG